MQRDSLVKKFLQELGMKQDIHNLYCDSWSAIVPRRRKFLEFNWEAVGVHFSETYAKDTLFNLYSVIGFLCYFYIFGNILSNLIYYIIVD